MANLFWGSGSEKPKDDARRTHERLHQELDKVQQQYKKLKGVVDQLETEYEQSKDLDFFRRYGILKGMIKRTIMHLKVAKEGSETSNVDGSAAIRLTEEKKKRELKYEDLTNEEINQQNETVQEQIKEYRRKISMIRDLIENMDRDYEASKRFVVVQRYRLLKTMTKIVTKNKYI